MLNSAKHRAARTLAAAGIPVIPIREDIIHVCEPNQHGKCPTCDGLKRPIINWTQERTTDPDTIDGWWQSGDWNIAFCPADAGMFAVDYDGVDPIQGPPTRLHSTPSGGYHALYKGDLPPSVKKLPGVDIRGRTSYILAPGSTINGAPYEVVDPQEPVEAPDWLIAKFGGNKTYDPLDAKDFEEDGLGSLAAAYAYMEALERNQEIPAAGNRNDFATKFALRLHGLGISHSTARRMLDAYTERTGGTPPDPDDCKIDDLFNRVWAGRTGQNPAGSELPDDPRSLLIGVNPVGDDGGPRLLNGADLDDYAGTGEWVVYDPADAPEPPAVDMLIAEWAERGIFDYHEGGGGLGKSYIATQDAICVQAGLPVMVQYETQRADVFYMNYEEPRAEFERRLYRIAKLINYGKPVDLSGFHTRHLRDTQGGHILRVTRQGQIIITRPGRELIAMLARRSDAGKHTYLILDGLMDAILFEGSTRSEDDIARQVIATLDLWCQQYDMTGRGILHPSRAGERTGGESYAPAWTTKPRARQVYQRVTYDGKGAKGGVYLPPQALFTRRSIAKRSHGIPGKYVDLQWEDGLWAPAAQGGGQEPLEVAVRLALQQDADGQRIKKDGKIGTAEVKLTNDSQIIQEYRRLTGGQHGDKHFLGMLKLALTSGRIGYQAGGGNFPAGYCAFVDRD